MYRLLVADDEADIRNGLADYFPWAEVGFTVVARAENGEEALQLITDEDVDVVLADIRMPIMSGLELARAVAERGLKVPIVFLSAHKDFAYAQKAMEYGVRRYLLKPTDYSEITATFRELKRELDTGIVDESAGNRSPPEHRADSRNATIETIKTYLRQEYSTASLTTAARIVHLNPQYLSRLFKSVTGEHFNEYLLAVKMGKAAELLCDPDYCTYEVSEIVGYGNPKNFARSFKRHFGLSPSHYRKSPQRRIPQPE